MSMTRRRARHAVWCLKILTSVLVLVLFAAAPRAWAAEETALQKVQKLAEVVAQKDASWDARWDAYRAVRDGWKTAKGQDAEAAKAAYEAIRADVANAIRREELPASGWLMAFFGATLMWGGLAFCIGVARKKGGSGGKGAA